MASNKQWIPLESNPEVLTSFGHALGLPRTAAFVDVWSLDLLDMVPAPHHAVLLLFPITHRIRAALDPPAAPPAPRDHSPQEPPQRGLKPFFCTQTIGNACGTIALLHAALNSPLRLVHDSFLKRFLDEGAQLSPDERAARLHADDALDRVHSQFAQEGQTAVPSQHDKIDMHFVCFVHYAGTLYELDGRRKRPVAHGATTADALLRDAAAVIKDKFMAADPDEHRFTIVALTNSPTATP